MRKGEHHNNIYSAADIHRYLQGEMPASEMHALEKAALEDPFLADAIEGYTEVTPNIAESRENELDKLRLRITDRITPERKLRVGSGNWWSIAAILIVLAGLGSIVYRMVNHNLLQPKNAITSNEPQRSQPASPDSNRPQDSSSNSVVPSNTNKQSAAPKAPELLSKKDMVRASKTPPRAPSPATVNVESSAVSNEQEAISSRQLGLMKERKAEDRPAAKTAARGHDLPEGSAFQNAMDNAEDRSLNPANAEPVTGYPAFRRYIEANRKKDTTANAIHGTVIVSFTINQEGTPGDFKIEKSLSATTDAEAIRLLKSGPAWRKLDNSKPSVAYSFNF